VGYRYFATAKREIHYCRHAGHEQYTRNMATGASTADLAVILVDGTKGCCRKRCGTPISRHCWAYPALWLQSTRWIW